MSDKKVEPPMTQRKFASPWGELNYLCMKIRYWLYTRKQKPGAERYLQRLERVLGDVPENDLAIIREEGFALLCELQGSIDKAIAHLKREVELMKRLHREAQSPQYDVSTRAYMLRDRDVADLQERWAIIELLKEQKLRQRVAVMHP